ncbi:hypothetical protein RQP46_005240 [Phenoliferia psychrophenolica]
MSSNGENFTTATITSLPTELIVKIVRLSSPKPSWDTATERSTHLRNLALVCQAMRGPAQEELFRHIVLRSISASRLFVAVLKSRAGARFASTPRSLRAGVAGKDWIEQEKLALPYITKRCSRLESLWLFEVDALDVAGLVSGTDSYDGDVISLIEFVNSLGGQLSSLCINYQDVKGFRIQSELLTSLQILDIGLPLDDLPPFLSSIPSHIRHFRAEPSQSEDPLLTDHAWATKLITQYLGDDKYHYDYIRARVVALDARGDWAPADVSDVLGITLEQYHALLSTPQRSTATDEDDKVTTKLKIKLEIKEEERAEAALRMTREDGVEPMEEGEILEGEQAVGTTLPGGKRSAPTDSTSATRDIKRRKEGGDTADQHQFETFFDSSNVLATPRLDSEDGRLAVGTPVLTIFAEKDSEFAWPAMIVDPSNLEGVPQALVSGTQAPDLYLVRKLPEGGFW